MKRLAWLRGVLGGSMPVLGAFALLLVTGIFVAAQLFGVEGASRAVLWSRGPAHHAVEFGLAALFTALARRAWARADLGELARRPRATEDDTAP